MPYIDSKVSVPMSREQEVEIKTRLGEAITILGKTESWLMLNFEDNCRMYFKGDNSNPIAYLEVNIFGSENPSAFNQMTAEICKIYKEVMGIDPGNVYVKYEALKNWGWNGGNF